MRVTQRQLEALFFVRGEPDRALFLGALPHPELPKDLSVHQWRRDLVLDLEREGFINQVRPEPGFQEVWLLGLSNFQENLGYVAQALQLVSSDGVVCMSVANDLGGPRYQKLFKSEGILVENASKKKCRVLTLQGQAPGEWSEFSQLRRGQHGLWTRPGLFSWDKVDKGTALLREQFEARISGRVADFGAGLGALTHDLTVDHLHLYENDGRAVEAARKNAPRAEVHWWDLTREPIDLEFDWVLMNPPFHRGKDEDRLLGFTLVERAYSVLVKGGRLLMVANDHLPYEQLLDERFRGYRRVAHRSGFKVLEARR